MRDIKKIIVHCSASDSRWDDSVHAVKRLHTASKDKVIRWGEYTTNGRGWSDIGYHFFIDKDGAIFRGRSLERVGAHCLGHNEDSIGVCVSGNHEFTQDQFDSLSLLLTSLVVRLGLDNKDVYPHSYFNKGKTCPNFSIEKDVEGFGGSCEAL